MALDIVKSVQDIQQMYKDSISSTYFRALIYGDKGTGKTNLARTCRRPIFLQSFDPDGASTVRDCIEAGWIIADTKYEGDDPRDPKAFEAFDREYQMRKREGFFENFGTVMIDSLTTLSAIIMNYVLKRNGHAGGIPVSGEKGKDNDYVYQRTYLENIVSALFKLPCDVIVTAHPDLSVGEDKKQYIGPLLTGQSAVKIPLLFSEMYATQISQTAKGPAFALLTGTNGLWRASSRLNNLGQLDQFEPPDIKALMKKAGFNVDDKAIPWLM